MPHRELSVEELIFLVVAKERERLLSGASDLLNPDRMRLFRALSNGIGSLFSKAGNPVDNPPVKASIEDLLGLLSDEPLFDRIARISDHDRNRFRKSIGNAIRRAIADIAEHDPQLADHLQSPALRMGYRLIYKPHAGVVWL